MLDDFGLIHSHPSNTPPRHSSGFSSSPSAGQTHQDYTLPLKKVLVYCGESYQEAESPPIPSSCFHGNCYADCVNVLMQDSTAVRLNVSLLWTGEWRVCMHVWVACLHTCESGVSAYMCEWRVCIHVWGACLHTCVGGVSAYMCGWRVCIHVRVACLHTCVSGVSAYMCGGRVCMHVWGACLHTCVGGVSACMCEWRVCIHV